MPSTALPTDSLIAQIESLERRMKQLEQQSAASTESHSANELRTLHNLFEYTILRPVDLVQLDGDPYFMYIKDLAYTLFAEHMPGSFVRNYQLTDQDLAPPKAFAFSLKDFLGGRCPVFPRNEHYFKLMICAHLWQQEVDFVMLDIGANIGYSAVPCASSCSGSGNPIAFSHLSRECRASCCGPTSS